MTYFAGNIHININAKGKRKACFKEGIFFAEMKPEVNQWIFHSAIVQPNLQM
jgi:hypothetical protein